MRRRSWLIAIVTALFVLQAPICALACASFSLPFTADSASRSASALMADTAAATHPATDSVAELDARGVGGAEHGDAPCHEPARSSSPSQPDGPDADCGCDDAYAAFVPSSDLASSNVPTQTVVVPSRVTQPWSAGVAWAQCVPPEATDLPPPDILLLKSTLLI